ncbi:general secretion pathway protein D [Thiohalorhabdus denitrificans]|uniref:General secretion pathway protein D n=2 Tax=Thiohalorhabdus denitrificans TaxID=381306 RepID=A0A1G5DNR9_9GAMM|nr:general secretion pathway protein D [Thiohalorhabdus denitrificans]
MGMGHVQTRLPEPVFPRAILLAVFLLASLAVWSGKARAEVNFDFEDADLRAVIQAVAEFSGRNFLVDPRVEGKVTVVAPTALTEEEAFKAFESVLEVNGYMTVREGGVTKIVPQEEGKHRAIEVNEGEDGDRMITKVVRLEHVSAQRMVPILRPLVPAYGHLVAYPDTAALILTDRASNINRLTNIIDRLDKPTEAGELEVIPLSNASAKELADMLGRLYTDQGQENEEQTVVLADPRTNSLIIRGRETTREEIQELADGLDTPTGTEGNTRVIYLKNADAEDMVEVLESTVTEENGGGQEGAGAVADITIKADSQTNALVVRASKSDFRAIKGVVDKLDVRRLQVYVEALIAEISVDQAREFGIQWQASENLEDGTGVVGGTSFSVGDSIQASAQNPLGLGSGLSVGYVDGTLELPGGTEIINMAGLLRALETRSHTNVLSTPNLLTMDNEEAEIMVGRNVPFVTGSYSSTDTGAGSAVQNPFQTIEREDVGLTLRITPQITEGSAIKMNIYQEVSSVDQRGEARDIVTRKRSLETTVIAENDRMIVLGGLIQTDNQESVQEVPILGRIPILGNLFRYKRTSETKTNLMVFLRPRIVRGPEDMTERTSTKYDFIKDLQKDEGSQEETPPPMEEWERIAPRDLNGPTNGNGEETEQ